MTVRQRLLLSVPAILLVVALVGCGSGTSTPAVQQATARLGTVFITGSDAPLPSVLAFQVTIQSMSLSGPGGTVAVLNQPTEVEFSRLLGLRTLLGLSAVPVGTYDSVTVSLGSPSVAYLDLSTNPSSVGTIAGSLTRSTVTIALKQPLVVAEGGLAGLHLHLSLRDSLRLDGAGQITGEVDPRIFIRAIPPEAEDALVDELRGGVVSVNVPGASFVLQTRGGRNITVRVTPDTDWEAGEGLAALAPPAMVEVTGRIQMDGSLRATHINVLTREIAFVSGLVLDVEPPSGLAQNLTLLVRQEMPDLPSIQVGRPATIRLLPSTQFGIHHFRLPIESLLFNASSMVRGQRISAGGSIVAGETPTLATRRVVLHRQGFDGLHVPRSVNVVSGNLGHFRLVVDGFFGYLFGEPLRVATSDRTRFLNLDGLAALESDTPQRLRVTGLLLRRGDGEAVLVAGTVERLLPRTE